MKFKGIHKKLIKRSVSLTVVMAMMVSGTGICDVVDGVIPFFETMKDSFSLIAHAEEDPTYNHNETTKDITVELSDFLKYAEDCQNNPIYHQYDIITISVTDQSNHFEAGFVGLGTEQYPFGGSIKIQSNTSITLNLDAPLFNYVYDSVEINNGNFLKMSRYYGTNIGTDETTPIIAKYVCPLPATDGEGDEDNSEEENTGENVNTWNIELTTPSDSDEHYLSKFGGMIGTMCENADLSLNITMNTVQVNEKNDNAPVELTGNDDLGFACCHMKESSTLKFTLTANRGISKIETSSGDVGGLVGEMETGANFTFNNSNPINDNALITTEEGYSGGIVGKNNQGEVILSDSGTYSITQYMSGTEGAGGIYGYYYPSKALTNNDAFETTKYGINCRVNGSGYTGGLFGVLDAANDVTIHCNDNSTITSNHYSGSCTAYGGIIGQYNAATKTQTLKIDSVSAKTSKTGTAEFYGGGIGEIESTEPSYAEFENFSVTAANANTLTFGGLAAGADNAFVKANGVTVTASSYKGGGLVGTLANGALEISGANNITGSSAVPAAGESKKVGKVVGYRDNGFVFKDSDASLNVRAADVDDIGSWGGILNYPSVLTVNSNHTITVNSPTYSLYTTISGTDDFIKSALNFQFDSSENKFLTFQTSQVDISLQNIDLTGNVDLTNTGVYGLTRDNDVSEDDSMKRCVYSGTFGNRSSKSTITFDTRIIYRHKYNGLIAKLNGGTVQNVIFGGNITVNAKEAMYAGTAAAVATGDFTATDLTVNTQMQYSGSSALYLGGILGEADSSIGNITVSNCTVNGDITDGNGNAVIGGVIGQISHNSDAAKDWRFQTVNVSGSIANSSSGNIGGLVAVITGSYDANTSHRTVTLDGVTIDGLTVSGSGDTMGGLLGYSWLKTDVNVTNVTVQDNSTDSAKKPTVSGGTSASCGMVYRATGKWTVTNLDIKNIVIDSSGSVGVIVNKGISHDDSAFYSASSRSAIYLCLPSDYTYKIESSNITSNSVDELCAYTAPDADSVLKNGNGVISINNSDFKTDGTNASGSYHAQTAKGAWANPNSRYYYNLDTVTSSTALESINANVDKNKLMSWGLNQYACTNLTQYFADPFGITITDGTYDMTGYSWYPVDLDKNITVNGTFKFYSHEFELSEDQKCSSETSNQFDRTNMKTGDTTTQHYTMHCGLFRNVTSGHTLTVGTTTFQGDVGLLNGGSGALVCGTVQGDSNTSKAAVNVTGSVTLDGVYVYGVNASETNYAPLLINKVGSYTNMTIANVSTTNEYLKTSVDGSSSTAPYITNKGEQNAYPKAASSLIGYVGLGTSPVSINISFNNIKLDGRTAEVTNTSINAELTGVYGSDRTIFTRATLLDQFKYVSGSTGSYNYTIDEDWENNSHSGKGVTYGKEVKYTSDDTTTEYPGLEQKYSGSQYYTHPVAYEATSAYTGFDNFLPYVFTPYNSSNNTHQLRVNHPASTATGCGTYNDPYLLKEDKDLEKYCKWINDGSFTSGDTIKIPTKNDTYTKSDNNITKINGTWCESDTEFTYNGTNFSGTIGGASYTISREVMRTYLAGAYYKIPEEVSSITIEAKQTDGFEGFGNTSDELAVFRGIIDGNNKTIVNNTGHPFIYQSYGSVVKDLIIEVDTDVSIEKGNGIPTKYSNDPVSSEQAYGSVIGKVLGGDNVIDNVTVKYGEDVHIDLSGTYCQSVAVGGYVGVAQKGCLMFRNMDRNKSADHKGISRGMVRFWENDQVKESDLVNSNNLKWLYVNPIVGRVLNAAVFTESDEYRPFENGTRASYNENGEAITIRDPKGSVTMQNGTKEYSIPDIDTDGDSFTLTDISYLNGATDTNNAGTGANNWKLYSNFTIEFPNAQSLYIMSLLAQTGLSSATFGSRSEQTNKLAGGYYESDDWGVASYKDYRSVHNAKYTDIGTSESNSSKVADYGLTASDGYWETGNRNKNKREKCVPYIIRKYTPELYLNKTNGKLADSTTGEKRGYIAFCLTHWYNYLNMEFTDTANTGIYYMPDGFRGIGMLGFATTVANQYGKEYKDAVPHIFGIEGNDVTISLNMSLNQYDTIQEKPDVNLSTQLTYLGFGFFNAMIQNKKAADNTLQNPDTDGYRPDVNHTIKDFSITGSVIYNVIDSLSGSPKKNTNQNNNQNNNQYYSVGGLAGSVPLSGENDDYYQVCIDSVNPTNLTVSGFTYAGGLLGKNLARTSNDYATDENIGFSKTYISNIAPKKLSVSGGLYAGGLIAYSQYTGLDVQNVNIKEPDVNVTMDFQNKKIESNAVGGIVGYVQTYSNNKDVKFENITLGGMANAVQNGRIGYYSLAEENYPNAKANEQIRAGGIVGYVKIETNRDEQTLPYPLMLKNCKVNNVDIYGHYVGGMIGYMNTVTGAGIFDSTVKTTNHAVIQGQHIHTDGDNVKGCGGIVGRGNAEVFHIDGCAVDGYSLNAERSVGGIVGYGNSAFSVRNCTVNDVDFTAYQYAGGIAGMLNNQVDGYNILLKDLSYTQFNVTRATSARWKSMSLWYGNIIGNRNSKVIKIAGLSVQNPMTGSKPFGNNVTLKTVTDGSYIVYADYNGKAITNERNKNHTNMFSDCDSDVIENNIALGSKTTVTEYTVIAQKDENGDSIVQSRTPTKGPNVTNDAAPVSGLGRGEKNITVTGNKISYETVTPTVDNITQVTDLSELTAENSIGFYIKDYSSQKYLTSDIYYPKGNNNDWTDDNQLITTNDLSEAALWFFEKVDNNFRIYTYCDIEGDHKDSKGDLNDPTIQKRYLSRRLGRPKPIALYTEEDHTKAIAYQSARGWGEDNPWDHDFIIESVSNGYTIKLTHNAKGTNYIHFTANNNGFWFNTSGAKTLTFWKPSTETEPTHSTFSSTNLVPTQYGTINGTLTNRTVPTNEQQTAYNTALEELNNDDHSYEVYTLTETVVENVYGYDENKAPYVTTNPKLDLTNTQFLTSDGVSSFNYNQSAFKKITDDQKNDAAKAYTVCDQLGLTANSDKFNAVKAEISDAATEYKAYFAEHEGSIKNFPLLVAEITNKTELTEIINNYVRTLTNTTFNYEDKSNNNIYDVKLSTYSFNGSEFVDSTDQTKGACLTNTQINGSYYFGMDAGWVDTKDIPQFTLMDIRFKDPANTSKVAYHLLIPIYVKKILRFNFNAEIRSGTDYYSANYSNIGTLRKQGLFENLGNPETIMFEYAYTRTAQDWIDAVNGGDSLLTNYYKSLSLKNHTNNAWAANTKMVLVDANNNDKCYYLDAPPTDNQTTINLYDFVDENGHHYAPVNWQDLMTVTVSPSNEGTLTPTENNTAVGATVYANETYYRPITEADTTIDETNRFTVTGITNIKSERYYLSIFTKADSNNNNIYRYEIASSDSFPAAAANGSWTVSNWRVNKVDKNTIINLFIGELYSNDLGLTVTPQVGGTTLMSATNRFLTINMTANVALTVNAQNSGIAENMNTFKDSAEIYQTFLMMYDKVELTDNSQQTHEIGINTDAAAVIGDRSYYYQAGNIRPAEGSTLDLSSSGGTPISTPEYIESDKYIELRNNKNLINELCNSANSYAVTLQVKFDMAYNEAELSYQFPKRDADNDSQAVIGANVIGYSKISSSIENAANSAALDTKVDNAKYYTTSETSATLQYEVDEDETSIAGPYNSLGINAVEENDGGSVPISTYAIYDTGSLKNVGDYVELTLTLSKKDNYVAPSIGNPTAAGTALPISDYIDDLKIYGADGDDENTEDDVIFTQPDETNTDSSEKKTIYKVRVEKSKLKTRADGIYIIPITYNVKTGNTLFNTNGLQYSNYKVSLTAAMYPSLESTKYSKPSYAYDHIIYTNARVLAQIIE